jgi:MFS family permease
MTRSRSRIHFHPGRDYRWIALSNTTLGVLAATLNASILLISLPPIFRGINLDPLAPANINYLLWMIMGYMIATSVLVVTCGRLGDIYGRARIYNIGFAIFTAAAIALSFIPGEGAQAAMYMIVVRVIQGIGGALLMANATAILTDAFPAHQRGLALGINSIAGIGGSFLGLLVGGLLADWDWRLVFWINVPFGILGTAWGFWKLKEVREPRHERLDWAGTITFGLGLVFLLTAINDGIQPYGGSVMAWGSPEVLTLIALGIVFLVAFVFIELRVARPMFDLKLLKIRPFLFGNLASLLGAIGRGGLQFMLIIWLQGIWLPLHGYSFESTPLWAGIFMLPLTVGFLVAGPVSGYLSDRYGSRPFATGGMLLGAATFLALMLLPADFPYWLFALLIFVNGIGTGLFASPNGIQIMNAVPPNERGQASGARATTMNAGQLLSIGVFFSLMIVGLASTLPSAMSGQLTLQHIPPDVAAKVGAEPPVASLFAAFLGYNPMGKLIPPDVLASIPAANAQTITGGAFFPSLISGPFMHGLAFAFSFSLFLYVLSAVASWLGGEKYVHREETAEDKNLGQAPAE